jgi:hypothetical protein
MHATIRFLLVLGAVMWMGSSTETDRNSARPPPADATHWNALLALQIDRLEDAISPSSENEAPDLFVRTGNARAALERLQKALASNPSEARLGAFADADQRLDELMATLSRLETKQQIPKQDVARLGESRDQLRLLFIFGEPPPREQLLRHVLDLLADETGQLRRTVQCAADPGHPRLTVLDGHLLRLVEATADLQVALETSRTLAVDDAFDRTWAEVARCLKELEPAENLAVLRRAQRLERLLDCLRQICGTKGERIGLIVRS